MAVGPAALRHCGDPQTGQPNIDSLTHELALNPRGMANRISQAIRDGARIINLSMGIPYPDHTPTRADTLNAARWVAAVQRTWSRFPAGDRPLLVISAGNFGVDAWWGSYPQMETHFPDEVIVVGGSNRAGDGMFVDEGQTSNVGPLVSVVAPAEEMVGFSGLNVLEPFGRTSAATPLVSGTAGLLLAFDPRLTTPQLHDLIMLGAERSGRSIGGFPMIDAYESLKEASQRPGAPLCGNRTYLDGPNFFTQRTGGPELLGTLDADTYANFFSFGAFTGSIGVQHGGKSVLVCVGPSSCGEYLTFQNNTWATTQTPPGEERVSNSGPRNSIMGLSHDGDSTATVTQVGTGSYAGVYEIRMVSVSTGQGRLVGTVTSSRTYNFGMDVSVAPGGDFLLLMGQWAAPLPPPDDWAAHADLYRMSLANGSSSLLRTWSNTALLGAQIAEDGREAVLVVNGQNTCSYEYISLPGGGALQTVPSSISYCDRHESRGTFLRRTLSSSLFRE